MIKTLAVVLGGLLALTLACVGEDATVPTPTGASVSLPAVAPIPTATPRPPAPTPEPPAATQDPTQTPGPPTAMPEPTQTPGPPTAMSEPTPTPKQPTATPKTPPTPEPTPDVRTQLLDALQSVLQDDVVNVILTADLGFGRGDVVLRKAIEDDVVKQVRSGMEWDFEPPGDDLANIVLTARVEVDVETEPLETLGGLVTVPALVGTIGVEQPYIVTVTDNMDFTWERDEDGLTINVTLSPAP